MKIAKKLKGKNILVNEKFSYETMELRSKKNQRDECKIGYLHYRTAAVKQRNNQGLIQLCLSRKRSFLNIEHMESYSRRYFRILVV